MFPTILLGVALFWKMRIGDPTLGTFFAVLAVSVAGGFIFRAKHYDARYRTLLSVISRDAHEQQMEMPDKPMDSDEG